MFTKLVISFHCCLFHIKQVSIPETVPANTLILQLVVLDNENDTITYYSQDIPPFLSLSSTQGTITVNSPLNKDKIAALQSFTLFANDNSNHTTNATVNLTVVSDTNYVPSYQRSIFYGNVSENSPIGTFIINLQATSDGPVQYKLSGTRDSLQLLYISPNGDLLTRWSIDYERYQSLSVNVTAFNIYNSTLYDTVIVNIMILDTIDTRPTFIRDVYRITVLPTTTNILATVTAISQDTNANIVYSLLNGTDMFSINSYGQITSLNQPISVGTYNLLIQANVSLLSTTTTIIITVDNRLNPLLYPSTIYVSTFLYNISPFLHISTLSTTSNSVMSIVSSPCQSHVHFQLNNSRLYLYDTITTGHHILNVSLVDDNGNIWYSTVNVTVNLITDNTLDHTLSIVFPNIQVDQFLELLLLPFVESVQSLLSCQHNCVDIVSVQDTPVGSEVAFAILQSDMISYESRSKIFNVVGFEKELQKELNWIVYFATDQCTDISCTNFQYCRNSFILSNYYTLTKGSVSITSHYFTSSFTCYCPPGYNSSGNCSSEIDECQSTDNICHFNSKCTDLVNDYKCDCPAYTSGKNCVVLCPSSSCECTANYCLNGGTCTVQSGNQVCDCPDGFTGPQCELTTVSITNSYISLPSINWGSQFSIQFMFSTINSNALLFYTGKYNWYTLVFHILLLGYNEDYIAIDIIFGSVRVFVQWSNWQNNVVITSNRSSLSDGNWHLIIVQLDNEVLTL